MIFRLYADGTVVDEEQFEDLDNSLPYYDDFGVYYVPDEIIDYVVDCNTPRPVSLESLIDLRQLIADELRQEKIDLVQKLSRITNREFGDKVSDFLNQYAQGHIK